MKREDRQTKSEQVEFFDNILFEIHSFKQYIKVPAVCKYTSEK